MPGSLQLAIAFIAPFVARGLAAAPMHSRKVELWNSGTCPYAQRAWIALKEKGIPFEIRKVDLQNKAATPEFEQAYRKANPNPMSSAKVPVLVVTDEASGESQVYTESKVVVEAIEELFPDGPHLLPANPVLRAKARLFSDAVYDAAFGGSRSAYQLVIRKMDAEEGKGTFDEEEEKRKLCESLNALDKALAGLSAEGPFVVGDCFSVAECTTAPFVQRADVVLSHFGGMDVLEICNSKGYERAGAWWKAMLERDSVVSTGVSKEDTIEGTKRLIGMIRARSKK